MRVARRLTAVLSQKLADFLGLLGLPGRHSVMRTIKQFKHGPGPDKFDSLDALIEHHFKFYSQPSHINRTGLTVALRQLNEKPALIVETGTSAWGTDSSRLFASYVASFGGQFHSVDIRPEASQRMASLAKDAHFHVGDSVEFLQNFNLPKPFKSIDLLYLDSMDLSVRLPDSSMEHGLNEFRASLPFLRKNSIVVIDDTPIEAHLLGSEAVEFTKKFGFFQGKEH